MRFAPLALLLMLAPGVVRADEDLRTVAEKSDYKATARYDDVVELGRKLAATSKRVVLSDLGVSTEGRTIPLWIVADPPVKTPEEAKASGKLVAFIIANIHAGEVCGKEALPVLVRELVTTPNPPLLKDYVLLIAPIYNCDGNEKFAKTNRPGQVGPEDGMGVRTNGQGLDLNRDFVKLEAPETRGFVKLLNTWDPHLFIDCHTTNGSHHRYTITYQGSKNPASDPGVLSFTRDKLMPGAGALLEKATGDRSFFYGNFDRDHKRWTTYGATPRFGTTYVGMRDRLSVLSEAYSYAPYKARIVATLEFVRGLLEFTAEHKEEARKVLAGRKAPKVGDEVAIRSDPKPSKEPVTVLGFVEEERDGRHVATKEPKDYPVILEEEFTPTFSVRRPYAYLVPARSAKAIELLKRHGLEMEELREDIFLDVEAYRVNDVKKAERPFEKHVTIDLDVTPRNESRKVGAGTILVRGEQKLGNLAVYLLEPRSDDGLATWNVLDDGIASGQDFPVLRLPAKADVLTAPAAPLPEDAPPKKPITFDMRPTGGRRGGGGAGGPMGWLDGSHFLQNRGGKLVKVEAETGRAEPFIDPAPMARALAAIPEVGKDDAEGLARPPFSTMNPAKTGALLTHKNDLYFASFDGKTAVRLTRSPDEAEELASFSPDGTQVAFVRKNDLWAVSIDEPKERPLTTGGTNALRHGKADWVYYEEIFNRNWKAYWWSPDSKRIAFFETDDSPVKTHVVLNDSGSDRIVEETPYPKSGAPNPRVRLGVAAVTGGAPRGSIRPGIPPIRP